MKAEIGLPFFSSFEPDPQLAWQMSRAEKYCLIGLLETLRPEVSIEIGTYQGGSLQVIHHYSGKVYSIDISPAPKQFLESKFPDVSFIVGQAGNEIHQLFREIEAQGKKLEFILVDGDHTKKGVAADLKVILSYPHKHPLTIIMHDSFNPQCRMGIRSAASADFPMISYVELDYITGSFWHNDTYREMWGGFAIMKLDPAKKETGVAIHESQGHLFRLTRIVSVHIWKDALRFLIPVKQWLYKKMGKSQRGDIYFTFDK